MVLVTSYINPDLDGIACAIAYSELLNKKGISATAFFSGNLGLEVEYVRTKSPSFPIGDSLNDLPHDPDSHYVLVDTADPNALDPHIDPVRVVELFDHRQLVFTDSFVNAKKHIELVGSCATLITEEFLKSHISPSLTSSIFLYSAIVSNTVNFQNSVTTSQDIEAASWLQQVVDLDEKYVRDMFLSKSQVTSDNLYTILSQDFAIKSFNSKTVGIAQIEMVDVARMEDELHRSLVEALERLKSENHLDYLLFTGIDVIKGFNLFYIIDSSSQSLFSEILNVPNLKPGSRSSSIIMRKQIWPKVEAALL